MSAEQPTTHDVLEHALRNVPLERRTTRLLISVMRRAGLELGWAQHPSSPGSAAPKNPGLDVECVRCGCRGRLVTGVSPWRVVHPASWCLVGFGGGRAS